MTNERLIVEVNRLGYSLGPQIGQGHNSKVYALLNCDKVIKVCFGEQALYGLRDYEIAKQLSETNPDLFLQIYEKYDFVCESERCFMYICERGQPIPHKTYTRLELFRLTADLIECLRILHDEAHIIHCDIKLDNILVRKDHRFTLIDYDISTNDNVVSSTGTIKRPIFAGSMANASPEAIEGVYSKRSDIYSLGMTIRRMFTQEASEYKDNDSLSVIKEKKRNQKPIKEDGSAFVDFINKATQFERQKRFLNIHEMREALYRAAYRDKTLHAFEQTSRICEEKIYKALIAYENGEKEKSLFYLSEGCDGTLGDYLLYILSSVDDKLIHLFISANNGFAPAMFELGKKLQDSELIIHAAHRYIPAFRYLTKLYRQGIIDAKKYQSISTENLTGDLWELRDI